MKPNEQDKSKFFTQLYEPVIGSLYAYIRKNSNPSFLCNDIYQTTLMLAYENINSLRDEKKFKSWIFTIGRREIVRFNKRYKKEFFIDDVFPERSENLIPRDADIRSLEEQILLEEEKEKVARWLSRLSAADKQFLKYYYYDERTYAEISDIMHIKQGTLRVMHHRILKRLEKIAKGDEYGK